MGETKAVVISGNVNLSDAIFGILSDYLDLKNIIMSNCENDAVMMAISVKPDFLIMTGDPLHYLTKGLHDFRELTDRGIQLIIIHDSDLDLYRDELNNILKDKTEYGKIMIVKFNKFNDMIHSLLA